MRATAVRAGHEVVVAEVVPDAAEVEHAVRRQRLREQRPGRHRELVRHRHDLELVIERGGDQLDDLADRQHLLVADVEDLARGRVGLLDREQQRVREVLGVAVVVEGEAVVGDDDARATVEDAPHDRATRAARAGSGP